MPANLMLANLMLANWLPHHQSPAPVTSSVMW